MSPLRTPHKGDPISAGDQKHVVEQLRGLDLTDASALKDIFHPGQTLVGEIVEILVGGSKPRYSWKVVYVKDPHTGVVEWLDSFIRGNQECLPYLVEVGHGAMDAPHGYGVGDRVLVHVVDGECGTAFIVDSGSGFWARLTAETGAGYYSWIRLASDAVTEVPNSTGTDNAREINLATGLPVDNGEPGLVVWMVWDGTDGCCFDSGVGGAALDSFWGTLASGGGTAVYPFTSAALGGPGVSGDATEVNGVVDIPAGTLVRIFGHAESGTWYFEYAGPAVLTPATSVVSETGWGQAPAVGEDVTYAREDHTHGTPTEPDIPSPRDGVEDETTFNIASAAGVSADYSRGDHTHGMPDIVGGPGIVIDFTAPAAPIWGIDLSANMGLEFSAAGNAGTLQVKVYADHGLVVDANGLYIKVYTDHGFVIDSNGAYVKVNGAAGVMVDGDGLAVKTSGSGPIYFDGGGGGQGLNLRVEGTTYPYSKVGTEGWIGILEPEADVWVVAHGGPGPMYLDTSSL